MLTQWTRQPPGTANPGVAWDSPLTRGLVGLAVPHLQRELVTGNLGVATTNFAPNTTNPFGLGGRTSEAVSTRLAFAGGWSKVSWPLTLVVVYRLRGTPTASNRIAGNWASNSYGYEITPSTTNFRAFITRAGAGIALTGNAVNTQLQVDILTIDATNGTYYQKGALVAGPTAHGGMVTPTGSFTFGSSNDGDSSHSAEYYFAALYRRILSDAEIAKISANPWQIFNPIVVPVKAPASGGTTVAPTKGALTFSGKVPTVAQTAHQTIAPVKGALTFTGYVPTVTRTDNQTVAPSKGALSFTGKQPTVTQTANQTVAPAKGALTFTGYVPTVTQESGTVIAPTKGALTFTGGIPTITQTANQIIVPSKGALTFTGKIPTVTQTGAVTYARAPRGGGYPGTKPTTTRGGQTNTTRPTMANTRR